MSKEQRVLLEDSIEEHDHRPFSFEPIERLALVYKQNSILGLGATMGIDIKDICLTK